MGLSLISWEVEGFGCIQKPVFYSPQTGAVLWNAANGTGKTTLLSALIWCLYGKALKDVPTSEIPTFEAERIKGFRGTRVIASLILPDGTELEVARHIKYKGTTFDVDGKDNLLIRLNGVLYTENVDKTEQNAYLAQLLGISYETLLNSTVFGQRMKRLAEAPPAEQRAQFEELFDLGWVEELKQKATAENAALQNEAGALEAKVALLSSQIEKHEADQATEQQLYDLNYKNYTENYDAVKSEVEVAQKQLHTVEETHNQLLKVKQDYETSKAVAESKCEANANTIRKFNQSLIEANGKHDYAVRQLEEASSQLAELDTDIAEYTKRLNELQLNDLQAVKDKAHTEYQNYVLVAEADPTELNKLANDVRDAENLLATCEKDVAHYKAQVAISEAALADDNNYTCKTCLQLLPEEKREGIYKQHEKALATALKAQAIEEAKLPELQANVERLKAARQAAHEAHIKANEHYQKVQAEYEQLKVAYRKASADYDAAYDRAAKLKSTIQQLQQQKDAGVKQYEDAVATAKANVEAIQVQLAEAKAQTAQLEFDRNFAENGLYEATAYYDAAAKDYQAAKQAVRAAEAKLASILEPSKDRLNYIAKQLKDAQVHKADYQQQFDAVNFRLKASQLLLNATRANGIKARVIGGLLASFNEAVNMFGHLLGVNVTFSVDETKASLPFKTKVDILHEGNWCTRSYASLSGGQQQRVSIAVNLGLVALMDSLNPSDFLILDEIFSGLDASAMEAAYDLLRTEALAHKKIIIISHEQPQGLQLRTELLTLSQGKLTIK